MRALSLLTIALGAFASNAAAQVTTLDFEELGAHSGQIEVPNCYQTQGFQIVMRQASACGYGSGPNGLAALVAYGPDLPQRYTGSNALAIFLSSWTPQISRVDGAHFTASAIDLASIWGTMLPVSQDVRFVGWRDGSIVATSLFTVPGGTAQLTPFTFSSAFSDLSMLTLSAPSGWIQFDNVQLAAVAPPPPTTTPEPASLALMGTGLAALGVVARRRRSC